MQSDAAESPPPGKHRDKASTLRSETKNFSLDQISEPKCVDSLCNSINTRLKLLEDEISTQHRVWETIQKEIIEVKSLIEDCASTCESSSISTQDNESDSEWNAHEECTHSLWNRLQRAEQKLQEKKAAMQLLVRQIRRIKQTNRNTQRKTERTNSNVDLILEVTNGLQYLKCDKCKFCNEHSDYRKGLVSSVIDLIHFNEKNSSITCEENKALKACLQKICVKMKSCYMQSQLFSKSHQYHHHSFDSDCEKFNIDGIYKTLDDFCQHFQKLQEEVLRLKNIYLSSEDVQGEDGCNQSHASNCKSFLMERVRDEIDDYEDDDAKLYKTNKKVGCSYEKKLKPFPHDETEDFYLDRRNVLEMNSYSPEAQLQSLRSKIFDAVHLVRDVEVEYNDDENLITTVASLSEECSALRQEVSYLRNVRQEKKKAWNRLQCFVMDAERKLKGTGRSIPNLREVIRDLGDMIASSDSSSLDETVLYMYSNQLEWLEKFSTGYESPTKNVNRIDDTEYEVLQSPRNRRCDTMRNTVGTQTSESASQKVMQGLRKPAVTETCDIAVQANESRDVWTSKSKTETYEGFFPEINREIYILPEVQEECDAIFVSNSYQTGKFHPSACSLPSLDEDFTSHGSFYHEGDAASPISIERSVSSHVIRETDQMILPASAIPNRSILPKLSFEQLLMAPSSGLRYNSPAMDVSERASGYGFDEAGLCAVQSLTHPVDFAVNSYGEKNICFYIFPENNSNITSLFSDILYNVFKDSLKYADFYHQDYNWSCFLLNSKHSNETSVGSLKCLPFSAHSEYDNQRDFCHEDATKLVVKVPHATPNPDVEAMLKAALIDRYLLSSMSGAVEYLPNINPSTFPSIHSEDDPFGFVPINNHKPSAKQSTNYDQTKLVPLNSINDETARPNLHRSNTFTRDSMKSDSSEESFLLTSVLSQVRGEKGNTTEKNFALYEINDSSSKDQSQVLMNFLETNVPHRETINKRYILCESTESGDLFNATPTASSNVVVFSKTGLEYQNEVASEMQSHSSIFPLLPSYLPFGDVDQSSLSHSCEIYDISSFDNVLKKDESSIFTPKQFLRVRTLYHPRHNTNEVVEERVIDCTFASPHSVQENSATVTVDNAGNRSFVKTNCASTQTMDLIENLESSEKTLKNICSTDTVCEERKKDTENNKEYDLVNETKKSEDENEKNNTKTMKHNNQNNLSKVKTPSQLEKSDQNSSGEEQAVLQSKESEQTTVRENQTLPQVEKSDKISKSEVQSLPELEQSDQLINSEVKLLPKLDQSDQNTKSELQSLPILEQSDQISKSEVQSPPVLEKSAQISKSEVQSLPEVKKQTDSISKSEAKLLHSVKKSEQINKSKEIQSLPQIEHSESDQISINKVQSLPQCEKSDQISKNEVQSTQLKQTDQISDNEKNIIHPLEQSGNINEEEENSPSKLEQLDNISIKEKKSLGHSTKSDQSSVNKIPKTEQSDPNNVDETQSLRQEQTNRETSLLDEISALKENLSQQNAVLQRLKEQSEETNSLLLQKEKKAEDLQIELNKLYKEANIVKMTTDLEEKFSQTNSPSELENNGEIQSELVSLRQENVKFCQKISKQTDAIQNIKAQLASTIIHLKNLKDAAAKQLKKQKAQHLKTIKIKQQLMDTKSALSKKLEEIEVKDEQLSDQEFNLHEIKARLDATVEDLNEKSKLISKYESGNAETVDSGCQTERRTAKEDKSSRVIDGKEPSATLEKHSELLLELQAKLEHVEAALTNKKGTEKHAENPVSNKISSDSKITEYMKDGNIWKLLTISEQSYLNLVSKLTDSLQISDLKGSQALMHSSWLSCDDLADARRQDHRRIIQSLEKLKKNFYYMQESISREQKSQISENIQADERKSGTMCHSDESHFQYLCEVLQKAQENVVREFSQKRPTPTQQRTVVTAGSGRTSRHVVSRERKVPLELKNGKILALLDNKVTHRDLLPNKQDYNRMDSRSGNGTTKSKTPS